MVLAHRWSMCPGLWPCPLCSNETTTIRWLIDHQGNPWSLLATVSSQLLAMLFHLQFVQIFNGSLVSRLVWTFCKDTSAFGKYYCLQVNCKKRRPPGWYNFFRVTEVENIGQIFTTWLSVTNNGERGIEILLIGWIRFLRGIIGAWTCWQEKLTSLTLFIGQLKPTTENYQKLF